MHKVFFRKAAYDYETLRPIVFELIDSVDSGIINKNSSVIIKPNLLAPAPPKSAILTHPMLVRASAEYVLQKGAVPVISDSPASGSFEKILKVSGITDALKGLNVVCREFKTSKTFDVGGPFRNIEISEDALDADVIINLPKLKTHVQMLMTLGIKNLYGCVVGLKKPEWHFRTGINREMFAQLLVGICKALGPQINILDGILAMEGQGPGKRGKPREIGILAACDNAAALDIAVCRMLKINTERMLTNRIAREMGMVAGEIVMEGQIPEVQDFKLPEMVPLVFGPKFLHGFMRRHLVQRPVIDDEVCKGCDECLKYCPAGAISDSRKKLKFDYERCIRCYCCIEVCPHAAINTGETYLGKGLRKVLKHRL
jgi:uncharacterized protein (DUF362 family)/Pyruvate/2-oxoacid:ferredoxin oxidoreductase delta subunit